MNATHREGRTAAALLVTNLVLGALVLLVACCTLYVAVFYQPNLSAHETEPYLDEVRQRLEQHRDEIRAEAVDLANEALPPVRTAIYAQAQEDYPVYLRTLQKQGDEFLQNVESIFLRQVKDQYRDYLQAHREVLQEEFPEHASQENVELVMKDFQEMSDRIIERYYLEQFRQKTERTMALWKRVETVEMPGPTEPTLQDQLAQYVADWTVLTMSNSSEEGTVASEQSPRTFTR